MKVVVNGEAREVTEGASVAQLLRALGLAAGRVAVEHNGRLVRREEHESTALAEGDRIEVVTLVGGG